MLIVSSRVGSDIYALAQSSHDELTPHHLVGQTFESKATVGVQRRTTSVVWAAAKCRLPNYLQQHFYKEPRKNFSQTQDDSGCSS